MHVVALPHGISHNTGGMPGYIFQNGQHMELSGSKKALFLLLVFIFIFAFTARSLEAEFVFMKDGSLVEGEIISENTSSINVKGADGKTTRIKRDDIMRILYTKLKMGKIYIQKRDGEGLVAYMVDED